LWLCHVFGEGFGFGGDDGDVSAVLVFEVLVKKSP
jgi:hypothetical protein